MTPEQIEELCEEFLVKLPPQMTRVEVRDVVCVLLFRLGLHQNDLPLFLLLVVDKYMGDETLTQTGD
jgi:hypothetical protein|tara:strand:- start:249 stop:449 length:201 start_codon:yes stop_codon:yes gene_type:complete